MNLLTFAWYSKKHLYKYIEYNERFKRDDNKWKIMIFYLKKIVYNKLTTALQCSKHYSNHLDKEKNLQTWKDELTNVIICIGILDTGKERRSLE